MSDNISIILPVFNGESFIEAQVRSIFKQTYPPTNLFIRDNRSTDKTTTIISKLCVEYSPQIHLIKSSYNQGLLQNINNLMQQVSQLPPTHSYIMFSDCDDIWLPNKISQTLEKMKEMEKLYGETTPLLVHTDLHVVDKNLNQINESFWQYSNIDPRNSHLPKLLNQNCVTGCTMIINRPLLQLALPIPNSAVMHDWWIALVAAIGGQISYLTTPTLLYRQHETNDTGAKKYGILKFSPKTSSKSNIHNKLIQQSQALLDRYAARLSKEQITVIKSFIRFKNKRFPLNVYYMIRHRFFKSGVLRNIKELLRCICSELT